MRETDENEVMECKGETTVTLFRVTPCSLSTLQHWYPSSVLNDLKMYDRQVGDTAFPLRKRLGGLAAAITSYWASLQQYS